MKHILLKILLLSSLFYLIACDSDWIGINDEGSNGNKWAKKGDDWGSNEHKDHGGHHGWQAQESGHQHDGKGHKAYNVGDKDWGYGNTHHDKGYADGHEREEEDHAAHDHEGKLKTGAQK